MVTPSEPSFPEEGATLDLERKDNQFRLKWGDKVEVGDFAVVDTGVVDNLSPIQVTRLVARHSKGVWSDAVTFPSKEERKEWDEVQEVSLLLGCRVSSKFTVKDNRVIVWTESPLRDRLDEEAGDMPHTIVRLEKDYYVGPMKVSDILK